LTLAKRIIPCLDVESGTVVKGVSFEKLRFAGGPVELAVKYRDDGADELVFLDISASTQKRATLVEMVRKVATNLDIPFTVGGGIRSEEDARDILCNGADKVSVNTAAVERPELISELSDRFGEQCVVVAVDAKHNTNFPSGYEVYTYSARKASGLDMIKWVKEVQRRRAGEILLTSIDQDGRKDGYEINMTRKVTSTVTLPVIASGGCGAPEHMYNVLDKAAADAALAASIFHYGEYSIQQVKEYLSEKGVAIRQ
jgi:cyclase